jgi:prevent-host-death family protein
LEQARNALSRLADAAHAGEVVTLTKHGRPWARLTPVESAEVAQRRLAARWAVAGVDLDPYLLIPQRHKADLLQQVARQTAAHPWGCDPAGLGEELLGQPVLLDTHVLQWWWCCPGLLSPLVRSLLKQPAQPIWVSAISLMELSAIARTAANLPLQTALTRVQLDLEDEGLPRPAGPTGAA